MEFQMKEELKKLGVDLPKTMERFVEDEELYLSCLERFAKDENFKKLGEVIQREKYEEAFDIAHNLKGVSANLGLNCLYNAVCGIVEPLRAKDYKELDSEYVKIMEEFGRVEKLAGI